MFDFLKWNEKEEIETFENKRKVVCELYDIDNNFIAVIYCDEVSVHPEKMNGDFCHSIAYVTINGNVPMKIGYVIAAPKVVNNGAVKLKLDI